MVRGNSQAVFFSFFFFVFYIMRSLFLGIRSFVKR